MVFGSGLTFLFLGCILVWWFGGAVCCGCTVMGCCFS